MTPQELKNSILQLAIQGKLVEQRPEEGTAEELYRQIQTEKAALIKAGKIKKEKPLPEISDDEKPFDIPESWKWVRIGNVLNLQAGKNITSADIFSEASLEHPYPCYGGNGCRGFVKTYNRSGHYAIIGRQGALCGNVNYARGDFYATEHAVVVEQFAGTSVLWCGYFLIALNLNQYATATAQPGLAVANINQVLIPIPPLAEQKRIVAKIEELLPLIDRYEQAWTRLENFNKRFPVDMQKSLLQFAIQGKLVEQRPEEGTGEELYRQIQAEKQSLIQSGKLKKEKPLPEITDDEKPFDIPESWKWCYIGDLFQHNTGKALNGSDKSGTPMTYITTSNLYWDRFELDKLKEMLFTEAEVEKCTVQKGDLLVCEGGDFGRSAIWSYDYPMRIQNHIHRLRPYSAICIRYFYYIFYHYKNAGIIAGKGIGIQGLSSNALHTLRIPLPPLAEQKRIVAKLEELLPLCDKLKRGIE